MADVPAAAKLTEEPGEQARNLLRLILSRAHEHPYEHAHADNASRVAADDPAWPN